MIQYNFDNLPLKSDDNWEIDVNPNADSKENVISA